MIPTNDSIVRWIQDYMEIPEHNTMVELPKRAFDTPLVGFSRADDPLYPFYKQHIGPDFHLLPTEWLESVYGHSFDPANVSIVSWVLPQTADTRALSRACSDCPTLEWHMARFHGEACNRALAKALEEYFVSLGIEAFAPMASERFSWGDSERFRIISNWSERHAAFIAGLGTFGLCDGLISPKGKAVRYGSVIVNLPLEPTPRPYKEYNEYCLSGSGCTSCIRRCPAGAISEKGHDKKKCQEYQMTRIKEICHDRYNYDGFSVCGLCQTGVPCESCIPGKGD